MADPQVFAYDGFAGGLNLLSPPRDIADNEVVEATNFEIGQGSTMRARRGLTILVDPDKPLGDTGADPVTSVFHYRANDGSECVLLTAGTRLFRMDVGGGEAIDIADTLTLPDGANWQWAVLNDQAIGVNGATTGDNPIVVASPSATAATALGVSPPRGMFIESFDSRLFIVDPASPNTLHYSALGDPTDWTTTGKAGAGSIEVGASEGDAITGIKGHRGMLFIFKRRRIYVLTPGSPTTDNQQWTVPVFSDLVGCVSGYSIQPLLGDLVFLSDSGLCSLSALQSTDELRASVLSSKVPGLLQFQRQYATPSVINMTDMQYWIATAETGTTPSTVWVLDYRNVAAGGAPAWTKWTGAVAGSSYGIVHESGVPKIYVGGSDGFVYRFGDDGVFSDNGTVYTKTLLTKSYSPGPNLWRKEFLYYGLEFELETNSVELQISYRIDERDDLLKTVTLTFPDSFAGMVWDVDSWDVGSWATSGTKSAEFTSSFRSVSVGRRGQVIQFRLYNNSAAGFQLKRITMGAAVLTKYRSGDAGVSLPIRPK